MAKFGLIGHPISHSKSPALFRAAYPDYRNTYELIEGENLQESMRRFMEGEYRGINVTSPFKDSVMQYISHPDRISSLLGSANVVLKGEGFSLDTPVLYSYNTDYYGVRNAFLEFTGGESFYRSNAEAEYKHIKRVLVVGAGGAGKAAALAMKDFGFQVNIANRSEGTVKTFAQSIDVEFVKIDSTDFSTLSMESIAPYVESADIIIYALSFLLNGFEKFDLSRKIVFEANYAKPSLAPAEKIASMTYIDGRKWLYHQAVPAFELFTGESPNELLMRKVIECL